MNAPSMNSAVLSMQDMLRQNADIRGGREKILANKEKYIMKLELQDDTEYKKMCEMAPYYILYPKVVDGFTGTVFSKSPNLVGLDLDSEIRNNVDMLGNSIDKFSEKIVSNVLENGFCASYNDYSSESKRPFIVFVHPWQFISFKTSNTKGYPEIDRFIYREIVEEQHPDEEFSTIEVDQYVVLDLFEGFYRTRVFKEDKIAKELIQTLESFPEKNGKKFDYIPIQIHGTSTTNFTIGKSPLQDISDMNISLFQRVVDQVYMLHWTALPTPYVTGVDEEDKIATTIGCSQAWHIPNSESKVGMLEFSGQSAQAHQDFVENLKDIMAATGAQILKKEGVSRETATSVLIRTAAQTSVIATVVKNISGQIEKILKTHVEWQGKKITEAFSYKLNDDFIKVDMEPNAQIALVKSWIDGAISHQSLFNKFKEGELIEPNKTFEQELADIAENPPPFFLENLEAKLSEIAQKRISQNDGGDQPNKDNTNGSNLENENLPNKLASEQV